ncbi:YT521-B-like domain-containing protein [Pholiota molesta]|nr:YT521-B-like domain-containing protein [Pholiota molesta]
MVEAQLDDPILRLKTPTPTRQLTQKPGPSLENSLICFTLEPTSDFRGRLQTYDSSILATPTINSGNPDTLGGSTHRRSDSMDADSRKGKPESSKSDHARPAFHRRRSRSTVPQQRPNTLHFSFHQVLDMPFLPPIARERANHPPTDFRASSLAFPSAAAPYPKGLASLDNTSMIPQNIHANYRPMVQPHAPVFSYQGQPSESISSAHPSFSGTRSPALYPPHQSHVSSAPTTPHLPSLPAPIPTPFVGSSPFHSLQYPSPMSVPFRYSTPTYPSSPMYQPQYPSPGFAQHYTPPGEVEPQVAWYYFSHLTSAPPPQQYDHSQPYQQGRYSIGYSQDGHSGSDAPFSPSGHHPSPNQAGPPSMPSIHPTDSNPSFDQYFEDQPSSDSQGQSGSGRLHHQGQIDGVAAIPAPSRMSSGGDRQASERPPVRRSYHPNPPANRSEFVMWAGNVPTGATHDELWRFFTAPPEDQPGDTTNGVLSIFLISRSSCAFINYHSDEGLQQAIARFDGVALRPNDPRCPRFVCRVRGQGDDLKAGVGYQRGMGMHTKWLRAQKGKTREVQTDSSEVSTSDDQPSSSPGSLSKSLTHAIFLTKYFPKRYFILKSLTQEDLDLSVERGVWATQKHNEEILDQAFRTSQEVYLIFGVNKSREFYGYARMRSLVRGGQQNVQWAARPAPPFGAVSRSLHSSPPPVPHTPFLSPGDGHLVEESPLPYTPMHTGKSSGPRHLHHSAPALLGEEYHKPTLESPRRQYLSLDQRRFIHEPDASTADEFELDASAPHWTVRAPAALHVVAEEGSEVSSSRDAEHHSNKPVIQQPEEVQRGEVSWGDSFVVEWISTTRFSFAQTRHLRNPWNRDKEIKVSRDGTELEPSVGERLLREWPQSAT